MKSSFAFGLRIGLFYLALVGCGRTKKTEATLTAGQTLTTPAHAAYVTNNGSDSVSLLDRDGTTVTSVPVDVDPDAHEAPHHIAVDPATHTAFVALGFPPAPPSGSTASKKDPHASHGNASDPGKLARLDLGTLAVRAAVDVDENPGDVVLTHDRKRILVTHFDMKRAMDVAARGAASPATMFASLVVLDATTLARIGARAICTAPHGIAVSADDRTAYIACYGGDELAIVDLRSDGLPTARVPLGAAPGVPGKPTYGPYSATLSPDDALVIVADLEGKDVRVLDPQTKKFGIAVPLAAKAFMPAFVAPRVLLVPTQAPDGLARVDLDAGKVTTRVALAKADCGLPHVVKVAHDRRVYLVCEGDHVGPGSVLEIDPDTLATKQRWTVGVYPDGIDFGD